MNDPANVRLVDTHPEGNGGAYHLHAVVDEILLCLVASRCTQSGVIDGRFYSMTEEHFGYFLRLVTAHAIDDATFIGALEDKFEYRPCLFLLLVSSAYIETQVGTVEGRNEGLRVFQGQLCHDVLTGNLVRRGGQCHDRCLWKTFADSLQLGIFRSEVVSPLRDAVCLVDGEKGNLDVFQQEIHFHQQPFG